MNTTRINKSLSLILCIVLIAAMALMAVGCSNNAISNENSQAPYASGSVLGKGAAAFDFVVVDAEGKESTFEIKTEDLTESGYPVSNIMLRKDYEAMQNAQ